MNPFQPVVDVETRLCAAVNGAIQSWDAELLCRIVQIEPDSLQSDHIELAESLRENYPEDGDGSDQLLEELIKGIVTETDESEDADGRPVQSWSSMVTFLRQWMAFLRDVYVENLLQVYERLKELLE